MSFNVLPRSPRCDGPNAAQMQTIARRQFPERYAFQCSRPDDSYILFGQFCVTRPKFILTSTSIGESTNPRRSGGIISPSLELASDRSSTSSPSFTRDDFPNRLISDTMLSRKVDDRRLGFGRVAFTNRPNQCVIERGHKAPPIDHPVGIVLLCALRQMIWTHAKSVIARMKDIFVCRKTADAQLIGNATGHFPSPRHAPLTHHSYEGAPVASNVCGFPRPAPRSTTIYFCPKSIGIDSPRSYIRYKFLAHSNHSTTRQH